MFKSKISSTSKSSSHVNVQWIFYFWQSLNGIRSGFIIQKDKYELPDEEQRVKVPILNLFMPATRDSMPKGLTYPNITKDLRLMPDKSTYEEKYWDSSVGIVFCKLFNTDGKPFHGCPRHLLEVALQQLKNYGLDLKVGLELEFILLDKDTMKPINTGTYGHIDSTFQVIQELTSAASVYEDKQIIVEKIHKELAPGQYELVLSYNDAMKAIDNYHILRQNIKNTFKHHVAYRPCFLPKISEDSLGNGLHIHFSLWQNGKNIFGDNKGQYGLSKFGEHFMAGILHHYGALLHFLCPSPNSIRRIKPDSSCGSYKFWGIENREAPIRLIDPISKTDSVSHFEVKSMDHTANQYIALAAIIVAGVQGIKQMLTLPAPYDGDPSLLSELELSQLRITKLPSTFDERRDAIFSKEGEPFRQFFGDELINNILSVHKEDFEYLVDKTLEEEVKILNERY